MISGHFFDSVSISMAWKDSDFRRVKDLLLDFADSIDFEMDYQDFLLELGSLNTLYSPPSGAAFLLNVDDVVKGCIGIWKIKPEVAELKRCHIYPSATNAKNIRLLLDVAIDWARQSGFGKIRLDPADTMPAAMKLYHQAGFSEIDHHFADVLNPGQRIFEFQLRPEPEIYKAKIYNYANSGRLNAQIG
jgi:putative acetyltransferase